MRSLCMKLSLKLANVTHTFEVTNSVSVKYSNEGMEIIEDISDNVVNTTVSVPVVQDTVGILKLSVTDLIDMIDHMSVDNDIVHVRELLKKYLSDTKFNDIIAALKIYVSEITRNVPDTIWYKRIRSLMCTSMFILSGFKFRKAIILLNGHPISEYMNENLYSCLKLGTCSTGHRIIAELLWPEHLRVYQAKQLVRARDNPKCNAKLRKYRQIVNALRCGYNYISVARFMNMHPDTIHAIKHNKHHASRCIGYDGIYPIGSDVIIPSDVTALDVHICQKCSCIIPVKDVLYANCTELCINCKNKKEEPQIS